jgi:hypothetical protein
MRSIIAIVAGYLVFAISAELLFALSGRDPHSSAGTAVMFFFIMCGIGAAVLGGYLAAWIARRNPVSHAVAVGGVLAMGALISLIARPGKGAIWTQVGALLFMAPSTVLGGLLRSKQMQSTGG